MVRGFTPIIGLAVVMALALAAVFGSMSLANPAMAAPEAPADSRLTERTVAPQDMPVLAIESSTATSVTLTFQAQEGYEDEHYEVRWREQDAGWGNGQWTGDAGTTNFTPDTAGEDATGVVIDGASAVGNNPALSAGETYVVQVRTNKTGESRGAIGEIVVMPQTAPTNTTQVTLTATAVTGGVELEWTWDEDTDGGGDVTGWQYQARAACTDNTVPADGDCTDTAATPVALPAQPADDVAVEEWANVDWMTMDVDADARMYTVMVSDDLAVGTPYQFRVRPLSGTSPGTATETVGLSEPAANDGSPTSGKAPLAAPKDPTFESDSTTGGGSARYEINFRLLERTNTLINDLIIELEDFGVPSSIRSASVTINAGDDTFTPEDVAVDGEEVFISIGDLTEDENRADYWLEAGTDVQVVFRKSAGITNPTEAGSFLAKITFGDLELETNEIAVVRKISLSEEDGGLGDEITATGKGYKNGTTLTVFLDTVVDVMYDDDMNDRTAMVRLPYDMAQAYNERVEAADGDPEGIGNVVAVPLDDNDMAVEILTMNQMMYARAPNGRLDLSDHVLCAVGKIDGNDVGNLRLHRNAHPTFSGGINYVNAVDGRNGYATEPDTFELKASISATPAGGSPGEIILVQVVDFDFNEGLEKVTLGRQDYCGGDNNPTGISRTCPGLSVDATGSGNFKITVPNWARAGVQELKVFGDMGNDGDANITIGGPRITVTPSSVLANQRISLVGTGFSPATIIGDDDLIPNQPDAENDISKISIGGDVIGRSRINGGDDVTVDSGGNWSAAVDLPFTEAVTAEGARTIRVTDSGGRTGTVIVEVAPRTVTITPDTGRVGTIAVVRGTGFPGKNDEGSSFNVEVEYDAGNDKTSTVSAQPDASGRFEVQLRIPTTASIPSTNTVKVSFEDDNDVAVVTTVAHSVPEGIITLSQTSGGPGSTVTISGEGFKSYVPVRSVTIGSIDVSPAPHPSTDVNGMMEFEVLIPGLDTGIQTIEVDVGQTTASTGFTVTESGINPGDIKPVAEATEDLGDNLVVVFHFNNDTKTWTFYSTNPDVADANTLTHMITGETYLLQIKSTQEVILNGDTRNLTCVGGNCWNQIVW